MGDEYVQEHILTGGIFAPVKAGVAVNSLGNLETVLLGEER